MEFKAIFNIVPYPKDPSLGDIILFPLVWAFLSLVCLCTNMVTALWPTVLSYLSFVLAFSPDKNLAVVVVSWFSLLRYWKPWAAATASLCQEVDLAIDFFFLTWFLIVLPVIVLTIWVGLKGFFCLTANDIVRRIHVAMEFEFDLTEYVVKCYSPMERGSTGDRAVAQLLAASGNRNFALEFLQSRPLTGPSKAGYDAIFRDRRPRRFVTRPFTEEELRDQARFRKFAKERCAQILAARKAEGTAAKQPINGPKLTPSDGEQRASIIEAAASVPQSRETTIPVAQFSAWLADPESDKVDKDVTVTSESLETEEPADKKVPKGEELVGPGPKAPEPEASSEVEGSGLLEGVEDSRAEEPESSLEEEGEGSLYEVGPVNDPEISLEVEGEALSHATVPEAAQELETSFEEEGDGLLNIDAAPTEEPEASSEADGESWTTLASVAESSVSDGLLDAGGNEDKTSFEGKFDVEMADAEPLGGMAVLGPSFTLCLDNFNSQDTILPLEAVGPWSSAGQGPGYHYDTRGWLAAPDDAPESEGHKYVTDVSPVVEIAGYQAYLEEDYANMDPDLLDRQIDDLLAGTTIGTPPTTHDSWFVEFEAWLDSLPGETVPEAADVIPAANPSDEDEVMEDLGRIPHAPASNSDDDSVTDMESLVSEFFCLGILRDSYLDKAMASMDLVGNDEPDPEVEFLTAALTQLTLTSVEGIFIKQQQRSRDDVEMAELQKPIPPVIVIDMAEPEDLTPPTDNMTELNGPIPPVIEMTEPEEPTPNVNGIVPDAVLDSHQHGASSPRSPYMGEDDEDWNEQEAMYEGVLPPQTPTRSKPTSDSEYELSDDISPSTAVSPGPSLLDELEAALLGMSPSRSPVRSPSPDLDEAPLWAFPPDMVDNYGGPATNLSLNELFNLRRTIEGEPTTQRAADDLSEEKPTLTDCVSGQDSVTEAQEPTPEDDTQAGNSESPDDDAALASGVVVAEEQQSVTETPVSDTIPTIIATPKPKRKEQVEVAPIRMGGLILPGGNLVMPTNPKPNRMEQAEVAPIRIGGLILPGGNLVLPTTPAPMTPLPQQVKKPDAEALRKQKEESLARDLRNVMRRRQAASIFHTKRPQKSSALIRSPEAAERDNLLRSPQPFQALSLAGSDPTGGVDAVDEGSPSVMLASPAVMKAIRDSEARRGVVREGNADER
ncbi:hypothetical protein V8C37DRAFT_417074 [Trichoderma ceciliae]